MTGAQVTLYTRIPGRESFGIPLLSGGSAQVILAAPAALQTYMPHPYGQGDITWTGSEFGMPAPGGTGPQVQKITVQIQHRVSDPSSFSGATAQIYSGATPVGSPAALTLSLTYVTDTFSITTGYAASQLPSLAVRVNYHAVSPGLTYINWTQASASFSDVNAITPFAITPAASMPGPAVTAINPGAWLIAAGPIAASLSPSFGRPTVAGNLLVAWVSSNSGSSTFDTTCGNPAWVLAGHAGGAFGWLSLWYKTPSAAGETAPVFTSAGATAPLSQLEEFRAYGATLDQFTGATGAQNFTITAASPDTRSNDLVVSAYAWRGTQPGPTTIGMTGTDSGGQPLPVQSQSNSSTTGTVFGASGWAQAGQPFGPGDDTVSATLGVFASGSAVLASFSIAAAPPFIPVRAPAIINRAVTIAGRIG